MGGCVRVWERVGSLQCCGVVAPIFGESSSHLYITTSSSITDAVPASAVVVTLWIWALQFGMSPKILHSLTFCDCHSCIFISDNMNLQFQLGYYWITLWKGLVNASKTCFFTCNISSFTLISAAPQMSKATWKMLEKYVPNECTLEAFPGIETDRFRHRMRIYCYLTLVFSTFETCFLSTIFCLKIHSLELFLSIVTPYYVIVTYISNHKISQTFTFWSS